MLRAKKRNEEKKKKSLGCAWTYTSVHLGDGHVLLERAIDGLHHLSVAEDEAGAVALGIAAVEGVPLAGLIREQGQPLELRGSDVVLELQFGEAEKYINT